MTNSSISRRAFLRLAGMTAAGVSLNAWVPLPKPSRESGETVQLFCQDWRTDRFPTMAEARRLAYTARHQIFTLGQVPVENMRSVCQQIRETQG